jgi:hypothetical protein
VHVHSFTPAVCLPLVQRCPCGWSGRRLRCVERRCSRSWRRPFHSCPTRGGHCWMGPWGLPWYVLCTPSSVPPALYPQLTPLCLPAPTLGSPVCPSYAHAAAVGRGVGPDSLAVLGRVWPVLNPHFAEGFWDQAPRSSSGKFRPALSWVHCVCAAGWWQSRPLRSTGQLRHGGGRQRWRGGECLQPTLLVLSKRCPAHPRSSDATHS